MAVERLGNGFLKLSARHALSRQPLEQRLAFVEKARGAVAALKGEVGDESLLQGREFAVLGMAFDGALRHFARTRAAVLSPEVRAASRWVMGIYPGRLDAALAVDAVIALFGKFGGNNWGPGPMNISPYTPTPFASAGTISGGLQ
jgi:hypothetical protein